MYAPDHELVTFKNRSHTVKHMISRGADIIRHLVFERLHTDCVHISGACNKVKFVGVLAGKLVGYEVAAVVKVLSFYEVIVADSVPAGGSDHSDGPAFLGGHQVFADIGASRTAATQKIKIAVAFPGFCGHHFWLTIRRNASSRQVKASLIIFFIL